MNPLRLVFEIHNPQSAIRHSVVRYVLFAFLLSALCSLPLARAFAQSATATLSGTVEDQNGAVVPGVNITVQNGSTSFERQATTNDSGSFTIPLLPPGIYTVVARRDGFTPVEVRNVVLSVNDQKALQIQLQAGDINATVQVTNEASLINESPAVGTVVDRRFVENLPLNGRSFHLLLQLTPGVVVTKAGGFEQGQFSVNGQRANANYFTVDGVSANIGATPSFAFSQSFAGGLPGLTVMGGTNNLVSIDALQEFEVQTSSYSSEFGRTPGGQISIVTRSGTNDFHGSLFDYFRNDALDANNWFANSRGLKKSPLRQNDFGGVLGGPILLPRFGEGGRQPLYKGRDRSFFFFSYEGLRLRQPNFASSDVPSLASRQLAPAAIQPFFNAFPIPNGKASASGYSEFFAGYSDPSTLNAVSLRLDHAVTRKLHLFARYNYAPSDSTLRGGGNSLNTLSHTRTTTNTITLGGTIELAKNISSDFHVNYSRYTGAGSLSLDTLGGAIPLPPSLVFPSSVNPNGSEFFLFLGDGNSSGLAMGRITNNVQRQTNIVHGVSIITGSHQLRFGIDYRRLSPIFAPRSYLQQANFSSVATAIAQQPLAEVVSVAAQAEQVNPIFTNLSVYAQDTWRLVPRLTVTYGLRWEYNPPPTEGNGNPPFAVNGLDNLATLTLAPRGTPLWDAGLTNFAPRIGVAYLLSQRKGKETVLRGGFGKFYDLGNGQAAAAFGGYPFTASRNLFGVTFPLTADQALPPSFSLNPPFSQVTAFPRSLKLPYTYHWNVAVEQGLGLNQSLSLSYVAAVGRQLLRQGRTFNSSPNFSRLLVISNDGTSDYHSAQLQFRRRMSRGLQTVASYTWSHSIDIASNDSSFNVLGSRLDPRSDRGPSDFDVRHAFTTALSYDLPVASRLGRLGGIALHGWSIDTVIIARSSTPVNVITLRTLGPDSSLSLRPDLVLGVPVYLNDPTAPGGRRINKSAFSIPTQQRQGTLERNGVRGLAAYQIDLAIRRQFGLGDKVKLQFRADFFNILNHPNFGDPSGNLRSSTFGVATQMLSSSLGGFSPLYQIGGSRSMQVALKLMF